jgi:hypothetical protein
MRGVELAREGRFSMLKVLSCHFLACFTCYVLAACSGPTPAHLVSSNVDLCSLVTTDDVSKIVGFQAQTVPETQTANPNNMVIKSCGYEYTNPLYSVNNGFATITHPTYVNLNLDINSDASTANDDFQTGTQIYQNVQMIHGLGDGAFGGYHSYPLDPDLNVLKDNVVLAIWFGNEIPLNALDLEKQIAQIALKAL